MCNPAALAAAAMVMTAASGVVSYVQGQEQAEAETKAAENAQAADYQRAALQQEQINAASAQDMTERMKQAMRERAALRVGAGEAGLNMGREEAASFQSQSHDIAIMEANRSSSVEQVQADKQAIAANAQSRINLAKSKVPSGFMAGLQIATDTAGKGIGTYAAAGGGKK